MGSKENPTYYWEALQETSRNQANLQVQRCFLGVDEAMRIVQKTCEARYNSEIEAKLVQLTVHVGPPAPPPKAPPPPPPPPPLPPPNRAGAKMRRLSKRFSCLKGPGTEPRLGMLPAQARNKRAPRMGNGRVAATAPGFRRLPPAAATSTAIPTSARRP